MELELIQLLIEGGSSAVLIYMLYDMRREARDQREYMQTLLKFLIERQFPGMSAAQVARDPNSPKL